jgi:thiol-disulfide isomerase/thioredoxin
MGPRVRILLTRALPAAAIVLAAGLGGFLAYGHLVESRLPVATVSLAAAAAPVTAAAAGSGEKAHPRRAIPDKLPDIAFADRHGVMRRLSGWKGRPLLVNFWAPWCSPCRQETPLLERLSRERSRNGLQVIGVAVDSRAEVLHYAHRAGIKYPLLIGERPGLQAVRALGMEAVFPFSVFVDARGSIVTVKIGELRADQARLILDLVDDLDRGRIDLATARHEISSGMARIAVAHARQTQGARS